MAWNYETFKELCRNADHGFFSRGFVREKSSLAGVMDLLDANALTVAVEAALQKIPEDKKKKYTAALNYLKKEYKVTEIPGRSISIGDHLEFLKSPIETTDCVIFGHSGLVPALGGKFTVPAGITLHFYTLHAQTNRTHPSQVLLTKPDDSEMKLFFETPDFHYDPAKKPIMVGAQVQMSVTSMTQQSPRFHKVNQLLRGDDLLEGKVFPGGRECWNYVVKNGLGEHWDPGAKGLTLKDIMKIQDKLVVQRQGINDAAQLSRAWVPHFVYVRSEGVILLGDLISLVHYRTRGEMIKDYYFAGCRGINVDWRPHVED